ncbi:TIGR03546 family protein, partial [Francisella tularensis subsp. holarctica]|nr:TIGR03546 family protein [Francisella tularensis subsp. holarctica]
NKQNVDKTVKFNLQNITGNNVKGLTIQDDGLDAESLAVSGQGTWQLSGIRNITFNIPHQLKFNNVAVIFKQLKQNVSDLT